MHCFCCNRTDKITLQWMYMYKHYKQVTVSTQCSLQSIKGRITAKYKQLTAYITIHDLLLSAILIICWSELFLHVYLHGKVLRMQKKRWTYADVEDISTPKLTPQPWKLCTIYRKGLVEYLRKIYISFLVLIILNLNYLK